MSQLKIGANKLHEEELFYDDGVTPLLIADLSLVRVEIIQHGRTLAEYKLKPIHEDPELQIGSGTPESSLIIEITKLLSSKFIGGVVTCKIYLEKTDSDFIVDQEFAPITEVELFEAVQ